MCPRELKRTREMHYESLRCLLSFILAAALVNPGFAQAVQMSNDGPQVPEKVREQQVDAACAANQSLAEVESSPGADQSTALPQAGFPGATRLPSLRMPFGNPVPDAPRPVTLFPEHAVPAQSEKGKSGTGLAMLITGLAAAGAGGYLVYKGMQGQEKAYQRGCACDTTCMFPDQPTYCRAVLQQCLDYYHTAPPVTYTETNVGQVTAGAALISGGVILAIVGIRKMH
jgi:hypothetical protein